MTSSLNKAISDCIPPCIPQREIQVSKFLDWLENGRQVFNIRLCVTVYVHVPQIMATIVFQQLLAILVLTVLVCPCYVCMHHTNQPWYTSAAWWHSGPYPTEGCSRSAHTLSEPAFSGSDFCCLWEACNQSSLTNRVPQYAASWLDSRTGVWMWKYD